MSENETPENEETYGATEPELPKLDELTVLKERATKMGIQFHPNIGVETLRERINAKLEGQDAPEEPSQVMSAAQLHQQAIPITKKETIAQRNQRLRREAGKLVRVRVNCMNPAKSDYEGEIFTVSNAVVGTFRKYVPYNNEEGWHIPKIMLDMLQEKQCQIFINAKGPRGQKVKKPKLIKEYAIEILPPLTERELRDLAQRQAMANNIDS